MDLFTLVQLDPPPQPHEQTDMIENNTFPQTTYASGNQHSLTTSSSLFFWHLFTHCKLDLFHLNGGCAFECNQPNGNSVHFGKR